MTPRDRRNRVMLEDWNNLFADLKKLRRPSAKRLLVKMEAAKNRWVSNDSYEIGPDFEHFQNEYLDLKFGKGKGPRN